MSWIYIIAVAIACICCIAFTPIVKVMALKMGAVDLPNERKVHSQAMPRMGGVAIYLAYAVTYIGFVFFTDAVATNIGYALLFGGAVIVCTGVLDDLYDLKPLHKLMGQIISASVAMYFGLQIQVISIPFVVENLYIGWLGIPLTLLWIVGITNSINLIDGLDGLASGVSGIAAFALFFVSLSVGNVMTAFMCIVLVGAIIGFLFFNSYPAKIFMGDSGSLFLGFFLATISLLELKQATMVSLIIPMLLLAVPISDTLYAIIRRKMNKQSISTADKFHLHHRLMALGLSHKKAVMLIYSISAFFAILAILMTKATLELSIIAFVFYFVFFEIFAESIGMTKHRPFVRLYAMVRAAFK